MDNKEQELPSASNPEDANTLPEDSAQESDIENLLSDIDSEYPTGTPATAESYPAEVSTKEAPTPSAPTPPLPNDNKRRIVMLTILTGILLVVLGVSVWWFFLKTPSTSSVPTPTPTPSGIAVSPSITPGAQTHLECRFGLCVEVPGPGANVCSSSFDCEQGGSQSSPTPDSTPSGTQPTATPASTTVAPTKPAVTNTPTITPTKALNPTATTVVTVAVTATPTPLASQLPESGTTSTTILISLVFLIFMAVGFVAIRKQ